MRPLSEATGRIASQTFSRKYISLGRIINQWPEIAGDKLADKAQPVKIRYRKQKNMKKGKPEAMLEIAVSAAHATVMHYQKGVILERINQIFGERWITAIRFVSVADNQNVPVESSAAKIFLSEDDKKSVLNLLQDIKDEDIKVRLNRLGEAILQKHKTV